MPAKKPVPEANATEAPIGPGSDRVFGFFFAASFGLVAAYAFWRGSPWGWPCAAAAALLAAAAGFAPGVLRPANRLWFALGMLLSRIVNPIVIGAMFYLVITPMGLVMRMFGKRPLSLRFEPAAQTYWVERKPGAPAPESLRDQF